MKKLINVAKMVTILGLLTLLLAVSVFTLGSSKAFAATTQAYHITSVTITNVKTSNEVQPLCGTSVRWSEWPGGTVLNGVSYTYGVSWTCAGANDQSWNIDWRDGNVDNDRCFVSPFDNCENGDFTVNHAYGAPGTYIAKVYNTFNSAIASWLTVTVN